MNNDPWPPGLAARRPTESDHPRVLAVMERWWAGLGGSDGARQRALLLPRLFFQHFTVGSTIVEDGDGTLVAFLVGFVSPSRPEVGYIHFVCVEPRRRGQGLGRTLYHRFFDDAAGQGATRRRLSHRPGQPGLRRVPHPDGVRHRARRHGRQRV